MAPILQSVCNWNTVSCSQFSSPTPESSWCVLLDFIVGWDICRLSNVVLSSWSCCSASSRPCGKSQSIRRNPIIKDKNEKFHRMKIYRLQERSSYRTQVRYYLPSSGFVYSEPCLVSPNASFLWAVEQAGYGESALLCRSPKLWLASQPSGNGR